MKELPITLSITTKAGLIGYYEGIIKALSNSLKSIPEEERSSLIKFYIKTMEDALERGNEVWQEIKTSTV